MQEQPFPEINWPEWFDDREELIYRAKGFFEAQVSICGKVVSVSFYDPVRLAQDIASEIEGGTIPVFRNLIVLQAVTKEAMQMAVERTAKELQ